MEMTLAHFMVQIGGETTVPLGPLYIAAVLDDMGCQVDFRDYQLSGYQNPLSQKSILDFLSNSEDFLCVSCLFNTLPFVLAALKKIKDKTPEKTIILGGPGPSSVAEKLMEKFSCIDVIVKGEGEATMKELAENTPLNRINGIVYRDNGKVVTTPKRERINNLDCLPFPAYDIIDLSLYDHAGIITARGCPYHCSFCEVAPLWGYHTEQRSVDQVIKEIQLLQEYGIDTIHFYDDTFVINRKWVLSFCEKLQKESIDISWMCNGRINLMDETLLSAMADAGCTAVQYGIESGSDHVLEKIEKKITVTQIKKIINSTSQYMDTISNFMWGFPFETLEDFFQTVYLMGEVATMGSLVSLFLLSPLYLSPIYKEYHTTLRFSEDLMSNLLGDVFDTILPEEKQEIIALIRQNPDIFSGFYHVYTPDLEKKYQFLKKAGWID
ncbi:MAG: radical SAM protein [Candidatus Methanofastidiosia archaeon]|jgi:radical SAM superfamily enzyme YgiQ (UPF0313 family)